MKINEALRESVCRRLMSNKVPHSRLRTRGRQAKWASKDATVGARENVAKKMTTAGLEPATVWYRRRSKPNALPLRQVATLVSLERRPRAAYDACDARPQRTGDSGTAADGSRSAPVGRAAGSDSCQLRSKVAGSSPAVVIFLFLCLQYQVIFLLSSLAGF